MNPAPPDQPDSKKPPEGGSLGSESTPAKADTPSIPDELDEILRKLITELNNINKKPVSREAVIEGYQSVESAKAKLAAHIRGAQTGQLADDTTLAAQEHEADNLSVVFERRNKIKDRLIQRRKAKAYHDAGGMYLADAVAERAEETALIAELEQELAFLDKLLLERGSDLPTEDLKPSTGTSDAPSPALQKEADNG